MEEHTTINVSKLVDTLASLAKITLKVYNNDSLMALLGVSERTLRKYRMKATCLTRKSETSSFIPMKISENFC